MAVGDCCVAGEGELFGICCDDTAGGNCGTVCRGGIMGIIDRVSEEYADEPVPLPALSDCDNIDDGEEITDCNNFEDRELIEVEFSRMDSCCWAVCKYDKASDIFLFWRDCLVLFRFKSTDCAIS